MSDKTYNNIKNGRNSTKWNLAYYIFKYEYCFFKILPPVTYYDLFILVFALNYFSLFIAYYYLKSNKGDSVGKSFLLFTIVFSFLIGTYLLIKNNQYSL